MTTTLLPFPELTVSGITTTQQDNVTANEIDTMKAHYNNYTLVKVTYYMASYFIWVVFVFGFPGNIASIFTIMSMPSMTSSKAHVAVLAVADTLAIISKVTYHEVSGHGAYLSTPGCNILMFIQQFLTVYVNWVVVAMTMERCLAVCFPLLIGQIYTKCTAVKVLVGFAFMTASVYFVMLWAFVEVDGGSSAFYCTLKAAYKPYLTGQIHYWLDACVGSIVPCAFILTGNALIWFNIRRAKKTQRHLISPVERGGQLQSRDQRQITAMLIVVSAVFLLLNIPNAVFYLTKTRWSENILKGSYEMAVFSFTNRFVHALTDANHAVNFFLYFVSMSTFRRKFTECIRCRNHRQRRLPSSSIMHRTSQFNLRCPQHAKLGESSRTDMNNTSTAAAAKELFARRVTGSINSTSNRTGSSSSGESSNTLKSFNVYGSTRVIRSNGYTTGRGATATSHV